MCLQVTLSNVLAQSSLDTLSNAGAAVVAQAQQVLDRSIYTTGESLRIIQDKQIFFGIIHVNPVVMTTTQNRFTPHFEGRQRGRNISQVVDLRSSLYVTLFFLPVSLTTTVIV